MNNCIADYSKENLFKIRLNFYKSRAFDIILYFIKWEIHLNPWENSIQNADFALFYGFIKDLIILNMTTKCFKYLLENN